MVTPSELEDIGIYTGLTVAGIILLGWFACILIDLIFSNNKTSKRNEKSTIS